MKTELVLVLYDRLFEEKCVSRRTFCDEFNISERTFYRYIREISGYLKKYKVNYYIDVKEPEGKYYALYGDFRRTDRYCQSCAWHRPI